MRTTGLKQARLRKRSPLLFALALLTLITSGSGRPLFAQATVNRDGLSITIQSAETKVPGYALFHVIAYNSTNEPRTLNGRITLNMQSPAGVPNPPPIVQGSCTVYLEIAPGSKSEGDIPCRGRDYTYWSFFIDGVYHFILPGPPSSSLRTEGSGTIRPNTTAGPEPEYPMRVACKLTNIEERVANDGIFLFASHRHTRGGGL